MDFLKNQGNNHANYYRKGRCLELTWLATPKEMVLWHKLAVLLEKSKINQKGKYMNK